MPLPKPRSGEQKDGFVSRCMGDDTMLDDFPDEDQRAAVCLNQWRRNRTENMALAQAVNSRLENYQSKYRKMDGEDYLVIPTVMLVPGVHCGSGGCVLYKAEDLRRNPGTWNGRPVTIQHPKTKDGIPCSCNSPEYYEKQVVGALFNTVYRNNKLISEAWIKVAKLAKLDKKLLADLETGKPVQVSTGLWFIAEPDKGTWNGEKYESVARFQEPDHLALLPGGVGACSWEDGCGIPRVNQGGSDMKVNIRNTARKPNYQRKETSDWGAVSKDMENYISGYYKHNPDAERDQDDTVSTVDEMPAAMKAWIASRSLLGDSEANEWANLSFFPVVNPDTNALNEGALRAVISGRGAQADIPADALSSARRTAYQLLNDEFDAGLDMPEDLEDGMGLLKKAANAFLQLVRGEEPIRKNEPECPDPKVNARDSRICEIIRAANSPFTKANKGELEKLSDETVTALWNAYVEVDGGKEEPTNQQTKVLQDFLEQWLEEIQQNANSGENDKDKEGIAMERKQAISDLKANGCTLSDAAFEAMTDEDIQSLGANFKKEPTERDKAIDQLRANGCNLSDKALDAMTDEEVIALGANYRKPKEEPKEEPKPEPKDEPKPSANAETIKALKENGCTFSEDVLKAMTEQELKALGELYGKEPEANYEGRGGARSIEVDNDEMPPVVLAKAE